MSKLIFVDVEPTGLGHNPKTCILELAAELWIDDRKVSDFYVKMKPRFDCEYDLVKSKKINWRKAQYFLTEDKSTVTNADGLVMFTAWLSKWINPREPEDKAWFLAYNAVERMDERCIMNWFKKNSNNYFHTFFDHDKLCVKAMAIDFLRNDVRLLINRKLPSLYTRITGKTVDKNQLHKANYDAKLCAELYYAIKNQRIEQIKNQIKNDLDNN